MAKNILNEIVKDVNQAEKAVAQAAPIVDLIAPQAAPILNAMAKAAPIVEAVDAAIVPQAAEAIPDPVVTHAAGPLSVPAVMGHEQGKQLAQEVTSQALAHIEAQQKVVAQTHNDFLAMVRSALAQCEQVLKHLHLDLHK